MKAVKALDSSGAVIAKDSAAVVSVRLAGQAVRAVELSALQLRPVMASSLVARDGPEHQIAAEPCEASGLCLLRSDLALMHLECGPPVRELMIGALDVE